MASIWQVYTQVRTTNTTQYCDITTYCDASVYNTTQRQQLIQLLAARIQLTKNILHYGCTALQPPLMAY